MEQVSTRRPAEKPAGPGYTRQLESNQLDCRLKYVNQSEGWQTLSQPQRACPWTSTLSPWGTAWASWSRHRRCRTWTCSPTATRSCPGETRRSRRPRSHPRQSLFSAPWGSSCRNRPSRCRAGTPRASGFQVDPFLAYIHGAVIHQCDSRSSIEGNASFSVEGHRLSRIPFSDIMMVGFWYFSFR